MKKETVLDNSMRWERTLCAFPSPSVPQSWEVGAADRDFPLFTCQRPAYGSARHPCHLPFQRRTYVWGPGAWFHRPRRANVSQPRRWYYCMVMTAPQSINQEMPQFHQTHVSPASENSGSLNISSLGTLTYQLLHCDVRAFRYMVGIVVGTKNDRATKETRHSQA